MSNRIQMILALLLIAAALLGPGFAGGMRGPLQLGKVSPAASVSPEVPVNAPQDAPDGGPGFSPVPPEAAAIDFSAVPAAAMGDHCAVPDACPA